MSYDRTPKEMTDTKIENNVEPDKEMSLTTGIREDPVPAQEEPVVEDPESTTKPPIRTIDTGGNPPMILQNILAKEFQTLKDYVIYKSNSETGHQYYALNTETKNIRKVWLVDEHWTFEDPSN